MGDVRPWTRILRDVLSGLFVFDFEQDLKAESLRNKDIFLALTVGELLGLPLHTSYYTLQLLPYVYEELPLWKRRACRERWIL
jgi:hypothetical protein